MNINNISGLNGIKFDNLTVKNPSGNEQDFVKYLENAFENVNQLIKKSEESNQLFAAGEVENIHQVMIDTAKAEIALQFTLQIRNKAVDAYNQIMRIQL